MSPGQPDAMVARRGCSGQNTIEYAVFLVVITAAFLAMATYVMRGISGKLRASSDSIGEQYGPASTTSKLTTTYSSLSTTTTLIQKDRDVNSDGIIDGNVMVTKTTLDAPETTNRTGFENVD